MKKIYAVLGIALAMLIAAAIIAFVWPMLAAMSVEGGLAPAIIMIIGCLGIGAVLTFLMIYSSRKGYDTDVQFAAKPDNNDQ